MLPELEAPMWNPPGKVVHLELLRRREEELEELEQRWAGGCEGHGRHFICKYLASANDYLSQGA